MAIYILVIIIAFSSGYYIEKRRASRQPLSGGFLLFSRQEDGPYLFLDLDLPPEQLIMHKHVSFQIKEVHDSQK